ncbi:UNVERIFIED_CONTAM: Gabbr1 [Trichonephila clavipes]
MTWSVAKSPRVAEQCDVNIKSINQNHVVRHQRALVQLNMIYFKATSPACSDTVEPIAGVAKHFNTIILSYSAEGALFSNRDKYPYFFRTIPENNQFRYVYMKLFKKLGYQRVAALTEDGQKYPEYLSYLQDSMESNGMTFLVNRKFPRDRDNLDMRPYLKDLKDKGAKIIIGDFFDYAARSVMCAAYKMPERARKQFPAGAIARDQPGFKCFAVDSLLIRCQIFFHLLASKPYRFRNLSSISDVFSPLFGDLLQSFGELHNSLFRKGPAMICEKLSQMLIYSLI